MNAALVNVRDLNKHYKILTTPPFLMLVYIFVFFKALQALIKNKLKKKHLSLALLNAFKFFGDLFIPAVCFKQKVFAWILRADVITLGCEE